MLNIIILVSRSRKSGAKRNLRNLHGIELEALVGETYLLTAGLKGQRKSHPRFIG